MFGKVRFSPGNWESVDICKTCGFVSCTGQSDFTFPWDPCPKCDTNKNWEEKVTTRFVYDELTFQERMKCSFDDNYPGHWETKDGRKVGK